MGERDASVQISDISLGGLAFTFHWPIATGVPIEVRVPVLAEQLALSGRVVRCERQDEGWVIGMAFDRREEVFRMRMVEQICHVEEYRKRVFDEDGRRLSCSEAATEWVALHAAHFPHCGL